MCDPHANRPRPFPQSRRRVDSRPGAWTPVGSRLSATNWCSRLFAASRLPMPFSSALAVNDSSKRCSLVHQHRHQRNEGFLMSGAGRASDVRRTPAGHAGRRCGNPDGLPQTRLRRRLIAALGGRRRESTARTCFGWPVTDSVFSFGPGARPPTRPIRRCGERSASRTRGSP